MRTPTKIGVYGSGLAVIFGVAWGLGAVVGPAPAPAVPAPGHGNAGPGPSATAVTASPGHGHE